MEYIPREHYLEQAKALSPGTTKKVPHPGCSESAAMMISNSSKGYGASCFKCGLNGFTPHDYLSLGEQLQYRKAADAERQKQNGQQAIRLPEDFSRTIPLSGLVWLWKYGITDEEIASFGIGWSEGLKRVILPVYSEGKECKRELIFWQGRSVSPDLKPKYLNIRSKTYGDVYFIRQTGEIYEAQISRPLVLVEDILSAIKVGRVTDCVSFLGSSISQRAYSLLRKYQQRVTWYDNDPAGYKAVSQYNLRFGCLAPARNMQTPRDPKEYSTRVIREIMREL